MTLHFKKQHGRCYLNFMRQKTEPIKTAISPVWPGKTKLKSEPDSWFLTPNPDS